MRKKLVSMLIAIVCMILIATGLVACNPDDGKDSAASNAEFVEYRQKVVAILKDNGIFVNDYDGVAGAKNLQRSRRKEIKREYRQVFSDNETLWKNLLVKEEYKGSEEEFEFAVRQIYGVSLRMSLCVGDGITTYFNENKFYGISARINDSYFQVDKEGNKSIVKVYAPDSDPGYTVYDRIEIEYNSETDYNFVSIEWHDDGNVFYAYGDSQKGVLVVNTYGDAMYSPNGRDFYVTTDKAVVNQCYDLIKDEVPASTDEYHALQNDVKYTLNDEQSSALYDKYFKDLALNVGELSGPQYLQWGEYNVLDSYIALNSEKTVEIPYGTEYVSYDFYIHDINGAVDTLVIPSTVKGVVRDKYWDEEIREWVEDPQIVSPELCEFEIGVNGEIKVLKNIIVEKGSPIFKEGSGHLFTKDEKPVCFVDKPLESMDEIGLLREYEISLIRDGVYNNLFNNITALDLDAINMAGNILQNLLVCIQYMKALKTINIRGAGNYDLMINGNLTVNVDANTSVFDLGDDGRIVRLTFDGRGKVTLNVKGLNNVDLGLITENVIVTTHYDLPKSYFERMGGSVDPNGVYAQESFDASIWDTIVRFQQIEIEEEKVLAVEYWGDSGEITVPKKLGNVDISALYFYDNGVDTQEISIDKSIKYIVFSDDAGSKNPSFRKIVYNGTKEEFDENVTIIDKQDIHTFMLVTTDGETLYQGANSPFVECSINVFGEITTFLANSQWREPHRVSIADWKLAPNANYYLMGENGMVGRITELSGELWLDLSKNTSFYLVKYAYGEFDEMNSLYKSQYYYTLTNPVNQQEYNLTIQIYYNSRNELSLNVGSHKIVGDIEFSDLRFDGKLNDLFSSFYAETYIMVDDGNGGFYTTLDGTIELRLLWDTDDDFNLVFNGVEIVEKTETGKDDKN